MYELMYRQWMGLSHGSYKLFVTNGATFLFFRIP